MAMPDTSTLLHIDPPAADLLFREARTANTFTSDPVSDEQLAAIYELVKWAPTSMNIQPLRVVALRSDESKQRLLPLLMEGNRGKTASAPLTVILAADTDFHELMSQTFPHNPGARELFADAERRTEVARFNALLQVGYFILGVRAAGLAAGPMSGFDAEGVDKEFFTDGRLKSLVVVNIGNPGPDAWLGRLPRLAHDQAVTAL